GVVDGSGTVDLAEQDGKTILTYGGDAQIGGTLASVGQRLIEGASKQMINQSLKALVEQIVARGAPPEGAAPPASASNGVATPTAARVAESPTAVAAEVDQARPAFASAEMASAAPVQQPLPSFEQRTVVVPENEQLTPGSVVRGIVEDALKERPWL